MPLITMILGIRVATPFVAIAATTVGLLMVRSNWRDADRRILLQLLGWAMLGVPPPPGGSARLSVALRARNGHRARAARFEPLEVGTGAGRAHAAAVGKEVADAIEAAETSPLLRDATKRTRGLYGPRNGASPGGPGA